MKTYLTTLFTIVTFSVTHSDPIVKLNSFGPFPIHQEMNKGMVINILGTPDSSSNYLYKTTGDTVSLLRYHDWYLMFTNNNLCSIEYTGMKYKTVENIGIGSTRKAIQKTYGKGNCPYNRNKNIIGYNSENEYIVEFHFKDNLLTKIIIRCHYV